MLDFIGDILAAVFFGRLQRRWTERYGVNGVRKRMMIIGGIALLLLIPIFIVT